MAYSKAKFKSIDDKKDPFVSDQCEQEMYLMDLPIQTLL